jgi:carboxymethylenebutenolidase
MFPDAGGLRDVFRGMGDRMASLGYVTLVPDVYYREGDWAPFDLATAFGDEKERARLFAIMGTLTNERVIADASAYVDFLLGRPEVAGSMIGTTGYCMGGRMSMLAAGGAESAGKIAATASFHGGRIAVAGDPSSPHLAADRIAATVYVAGAVEDGSFTAEQAELLDAALAAGVDHTVEFYPAHHGFAVPDHETFDESASDRHWDALQRLYAAALA